MATTLLPPDFKEFLQLLNRHQIEYLLIGGYAVNIYGYTRPTGDMDIWVAVHENNAKQLVQVFEQFGLKGLSPDLFLNDKMLRIGEKPFRLEILKTISGVIFESCYPNRNIQRIDGVEVSVIDLENLKKK